MEQLPLSLLHRILPLIYLPIAAIRIAVQHKSTRMRWGIGKTNSSKKINNGALLLQKNIRRKKEELIRKVHCRALL